MAHVKEHWFPYLIGMVILIVIIIKMQSVDVGKGNQHNFSVYVESSLVPDIYSLSGSEKTNLILYGKELVENTSAYFGPHGSIAAISNGLNCQNCHMERGTKLYTNNFLGVASSYPKFRERSGKWESV